MDNFLLTTFSNTPHFKDEQLKLPIYIISCVLISFFYKYRSFL